MFRNRSAAIVLASSLFIIGAVHSADRMGTHQSLSSINYAIRLDGANDYIEIPDGPGFHFGQQATIEFWVKLNSKAAGVAFNKWTVNLEDKQMIFSGESHLTFHLHGPEGSGQSRYSRTVFQVGKWYHVAGTTDGTTLYIVVNGVLDTSWTGTGADIGDASGPAIIGATFFRNPADIAINGEIDELRIWNVYRSPSEIKSMMYKEATGSEPGLSALYHFNEGTGQFTSDNSVFHNSGRLGPTSGSDSQDPKWIRSTAPIGEALPTLRFPVDDYFPINFGWGLKRGSGLHVAEDISGYKAGTPVYAMADGKIMLAEVHGGVCKANGGNWGPLVVIEHTLADNSRVCSIYGHIAFSVSEGQQVLKGQQIGSVADLSCPEGWMDHLHFGIYKAAFGAAQGVYPVWLRGYLAPSQFPGKYVKPSDFITGYNRRRSAITLSCKANMIVITPTNDTISVYQNTSPNAEYQSWQDVYSDDSTETIDQVEFDDPDSGSYQILVSPDSGTVDTSTYSLFVYDDSSSASLVTNQLVNEAPVQGFASNLSCCFGITGNVDCDVSNGVDISDLSALIDYLYISFVPLCCQPEANADGQPGIDISDLTALIDYLYISFTPPATCQ